MTYALAAIVAAAGSFIQSAGGFGYAIVCMALWPLFLPFRVAAVMEVMTAFVMVVYIACRMWRHINWRLLLWPLLSSVCASTVGVMTLMASTESAMRRILGVALTLLSCYFIFAGGRVKLRPTRLNGILAGLVSGFFGGLFNIGGPPMVAYFISVTDDKNEYNATLQCYFVFTTIYIFIMHLILGNVTGEVLRFSAAALLGVFAGTACGMAVFRRLPLGQIKKFVYAFMAAAGAYLFITG